MPVQNPTLIKLLGLQQMKIEGNSKSLLIHPPIIIQIKKKTSYSDDRVDLKPSPH